MKIYLNKMAQKMLFSYYEGVDWADSLTKDNPNPKNIPIDLYLPLSDKEKDRIHNKVLTWVGNYEKLFNGKYAEIETDDEILSYLSIDSDAQASFIKDEVLNPSSSVEDIFEAYVVNGKEYDRVKKDKEKLYKEYVQALKQFQKLKRRRISINTEFQADNKIQVSARKSTNNNPELKTKGEI